MAFSASLAARIRDAVGQSKGIQEKKMFGGIAFMLNGNMCVGVWKDSMIVRLGPDQGQAALKEPHVREFDMTARAMKGWIMVEPEGVDDDQHLNRWIGRAVKFVSTLPKK